MKQYEKYKASGVEWLGEVPEHWNIVPFKRGVNINNGRDYKHIVSDIGFPVIGSGGQFASALEYMHDGEVVFLGRKGTIDKPQYFHGKFWAVDTIFYAIAYNNSFTKYLYYQAINFPFDLYSTSTALPSMTQTDLGNNPICLPPKSEQETIAKYLDYTIGKVDELVAQKEGLIVKLEEKRKAVINEMVTRGLNPNAPMRPSGIDWLDEIPAHWLVIPLKRCVNINNGRDYKSIVSDGGYPVVGSGGQFAFCSEYIYDGEVVFLGRKGTIDKPRYFKGKFWAVDTMFYAIPKTNAVCKYVYYQALNFPFDLYSTATALPSMTQTDLGNHTVCLPPIAEQTEIVKFIEAKTSKIDKLIEEITLQIEKLKEYKTAIISETVTGKIDVREWQQPTNK